MTNREHYQELETYVDLLLELQNLLGISVISVMELTQSNVLLSALIMQLVVVLQISHIVKVIQKFLGQNHLRDKQSVVLAKKVIKEKQLLTPMLTLTLQIYHQITIVR